MTCINKSALIPYSAEKMYQLVADVNSYEQFLPWTPEMLQENYQDLCDIVQSVKEGKDDRARHQAHRHVQRFSEYMGNRTDT